MFTMDLCAQVHGGWGGGKNLAHVSISREPEMKPRGSSDWSGLRVDRDYETEILTISYLHGVSRTAKGRPFTRVG